MCNLLLLSEKKVTIVKRIYDKNNCTKISFPAIIISPRDYSRRYRTLFSPGIEFRVCLCYPLKSNPQNNHGIIILNNSLV